MASKRRGRLRIKGWTFYGEWAGTADDRPPAGAIPSALLPAGDPGGVVVDQVEEQPPAAEQRGLW